MILAIETTGNACGVALHNGERIVALREDERPRIHDVVLMSQVEDVLREQGIAPRELEAVACSVGPGSFTGLRIGLSMAKGLCFATGKKLVPVPTLDMLAIAAVAHAAESKARQIVVAIAAEGDKCYVGVFDPRGQRLEEYRTVRRAELPALDGKTLVIGSAASYFSVLETDPVVVVDRPSVRHVASLGAQLYYQSGVAADPAGVEPLYVTPVIHTALSGR